MIGGVVHEGMVVGEKKVQLKKPPRVGVYIKWGGWGRGGGGAFSPFGRGGSHHFGGGFTLLPVAHGFHRGPWWACATL